MFSSEGMKKIPVQLKIGILMILAVGIIGWAGYLSYVNISSIVTSIKEEGQPETGLLRVRSISASLEKAQTNLRLFAVTGDSSYLKLYKVAINSVNRELTGLKREFSYDTLMIARTDTIRTLISENIWVWNRYLLSLSEKKQASDYLDIISAKVEQNIAVDTTEKKGLFRRIFNKKKKDTSNREQELVNDLREIKQQDSLSRASQTRTEKQLATSGTEIRRQIYELIARIENGIYESINTKAEHADTLAQKTYKWLGFFIMLISLLAIAVMIIIVNYVRKANRYQKAILNAREETEKLSKMKELFLANVSHELRTPVTAISGFAGQLLSDNPDSSVSEKLNIIKSSSDHLTSVINDILDFSKLQNDSVKLEEIHFLPSALPREVCAMFEGQATVNNNTIHPSVDLNVPEALVGDPYRIRQIMINLVSNSVKFTRNGTISCSLKCRKQDYPWVHLIIEVSDTGIGIDQNRIDHIFDEFTQEDESTTRKYGGTGLGLSIVKKLTTLHGGKIEINSKKNEGTTIRCILPLKEGRSSEAKKLSAPPVEVPGFVRKMKILVVDDQEYNRVLFRSILTRWQVSHKEAANAEDAIALLRRERFSMIFMDDRMPGTDGLTATRFIRNEMGIKKSQMAIICISAASPENPGRYLEAGMNTFLPKPFTEEALLKAIISISVYEKQDRNIKPDRNEKPGIQDNKLNLKSGKPEAEPDNTPGSDINIDKLYHIAGGDKAFVKQMLVSFLESTGKGISETREVLNHGRNLSAAGILHSLLPPCRHVGADELCRILKETETAVKANDINKALLMTEQAVREYDRVCQVLNRQIIQMEQRKI